VCRQFIQLCQQLGLFSQAIVAIDGSKFKAVNKRDKNFTSAKMERCKQQIEDSINRYLAALDTADQEEPAAAQAKTVHWKRDRALKSGGKHPTNLSENASRPGQTTIAYRS